jgi:hypothetical protein
VGREWIPQDQVKGRARKYGVAATPPTRIVNDNELPYESVNTLPNGVTSEGGLAGLLDFDADVGQRQSSGIINEGLPADSIDLPEYGTVNIFRTIWAYLTLFGGS